MAKIDEKELKSIFRQYAIKNGYAETPPTILDFITDEFYLGKVFNYGKGLYKFWYNLLIQMFPTPFPEINKTKYSNQISQAYIVANTSAIGTGKCLGQNQEIEVLIKKWRHRQLNIKSDDEYFTFKIKDFFDLLKIKHEDNDFNNIIGQTHHIDIPIYIRTPFGYSKINFLVTKRSDVYRYILENGEILETSNKHIVIENGNAVKIESASSVDNVDGNSYKIIKKELIEENAIVYDLNIHSPHLYVTPDGSIHHNTTVSNIIFMYDLAHVLCLESPQKFYKLAANTKIEFILSNSSRDNAESINFSLIMEMIRNSPFFLSKLNQSTKSSMFINNVDLHAVSPVRRSITGRAVFSILIDELNRHPIPKRGFEYVTEAINRLPSRFLSEHDGKKYVPGHVLLISSADDDNSILERVKLSLKESEDDNDIEKQFFTIRASQFEVLKEKINFKKKTFTVFVGTFDLEPKIIEDEEEKEFYKKEYPDLVFEVPYDYYLTFKQNLRQAIGDILAYPVTSASSFIPSKAVIKQRMLHDNPCPYIIEYDNTFPLINFFNDKLLRTILEPYKGKQFAIGLDLAYSNDMLGISLGCIKEIKESEEEQLNEKVIDIVFATGIKPKGETQLKFSKVREFIIDLKEKYDIFIEAIYVDTYQSYDFVTIMQDLGFNAKQHSVDKQKAPYYALKNALYEENIILPKNDVLLKELIYLKEDEKKIDHPDAFPDGTKGSKDIADAVCQCYNALLNEVNYKPFFEKDYIEELNTILDKELLSVQLGIDTSNMANIQEILGLGE